MDLGLKDKVAVITGGSTGIGLAVARGLAYEKVHVVLCARNETAAVEQARLIRQEYGVEALGHREGVVTGVGPYDTLSSAQDAGCHRNRTRRRRAAWVHRWAMALATWAARRALFSRRAMFASRDREPVWCSMAPRRKGVTSRPRMPWAAASV